MWKRHLLFIALIVGGVLALRARFAPGRPDARPAETIAPAWQSPPIVGKVDRLFQDQWAEEHLQPTARATELALLRRLALALTGAVPSLEEVRRFEAVPEGRRLDDWLNAVFQDRRYTDYCAERLARAFVGTEGGPFLIFRRRRFVTWLSDQLMERRPYDQIVRDLIASDGVWTDRPATNFVTVTYDPAKKLPDPERLAARTARAFLGVRLDCAQCHDHPFQPWKQRDFQGLAAFYGQAQSGFTGIHDVAGEYQLTNRKTGQPETIEPRVPFLPELWRPDGDRRAQLAAWVTHPDNPHLARATVNRVWALLFGRPLVEPVDDLLSAGDPPPVLLLLAADFAGHGYDLQRLVRVIAATEVFRLDSAGAVDVSEDQEKSWAAFPMTRLRPEQVAGSLIQAGSLETIDAQSPILVKLGRSFGQANFVKRYGDTGDDEFDGGSGTIPQRLLMLNGDLVESKTKDDIFSAATRIAIVAPTDRSAVEAAYLTVLTRRPTPEERAYFETRLSETKGKKRHERLADLFWDLVNTTEFSWNH